MLETASYNHKKKISKDDPTIRNQLNVWYAELRRRGELK